MGAFISLFSPFSWLARWRDGLGGQRGQQQGASRGDELPELFTWGGGGDALAWLLPISFTSGWASPLESLARHRGAAWKSPSGSESHKCVNKRNDQSLLLCPRNSGLAGGVPGCEFFPAPICKPRRLGRKSFGKGFFQGKLMFPVLLQLFVFQVTD